MLLISIIEISVRAGKYIGLRQAFQSCFLIPHLNSLWHLQLEVNADRALKILWNEIARDHQCSDQFEKLGLRKRLNRRIKRSGHELLIVLLG